MTIQFLRTWNGYEAGQTVTLGGGEESRLVGLGLARAWYPGMDGVSDDGDGVEQITSGQVASPTIAMLSIERRFVTWVSPDGKRYRSDATATAVGTALVEVGAGGGGSTAIALTGLSLATTGAVAATDTILQGFGKLEATKVSSTAVANAISAAVMPVQVGNLETLAGSAFGMWIALAAGSSSTAGYGILAPSPLDTGAGAGPGSSSDLAGLKPRVRYTSQAAANNRVAGVGWSVNVGCAMILNSGGVFNGGFPIVIEAAASDAISAASFWMGLTNESSPNFTTVEPSAYTKDMIGFGWDSTGANGYIFRNTNGGTAVGTNLGADFAKTQGQLYRISIDKNRAGTELYVKVVKVVTNGPNIESATYTFTTDLPRSTVTIAPSIARSSMASGATVSIDIAGIWRGVLPGNGSQLVTINEQTASYVLAITDSWAQVDMNVATPNTLTIPLNSTVPFPIGQVISVTQKGAGATTIAIAGGGTLLKPTARSLTISGQYESAQLHKVGTDTWRVTAS